MAAGRKQDMGRQLLHELSCRAESPRMIQSKGAERAPDCLAVPGMLSAHGSARVAVRAEQLAHPQRIHPCCLRVASRLHLSVASQVWLAGAHRWACDSRYLGASTKRRARLRQSEGSLLGWQRGKQRSFCLSSPALWSRE